MVSSLALTSLLGFSLAVDPSKLLTSHNLSNRESIVRRQNPQNYTAHTIDQPIDHFPTSPIYVPHTNATFKQRYYFDDYYYKPGGPVFLYIGGETSGPSRFENLQNGIIQILMQATNGLGVILENRYYGESYPFGSSTTDQLAYMTNQQTIADNAYFAQHAVFPGVNATLNAPDTPWILYGGSLAGAQTAFSIKQYGDVLYGGIAASAVIHAVHAYPQWYAPIQKFGPQDCISYLNKIVSRFDTLVQTNNTAAITQFKTLFGLQSLTDIRDFAMTIAFPIGGPLNYPTNTWQELNWSPLYGSQDFFHFCSNITDPTAPHNITALDHALSSYTNNDPWTGLGAYANYIKQIILPLCPSADYDSTACFGTQNASYWADTTNSALRSYLYSTCTEQGAYQVAPATGPRLISQVLQVDYTQQWCEWAFPAGEYNSIPPTPDLSRYNHFGGFNLSADRLAFVDGANDVWLDVCYHSDDAPRRTSSDLRPEYLIAGAGHHWDSYGIGDVGAEPMFVREAHRWEVRTVRRWLSGFEAWRAGRG